MVGCSVFGWPGYVSCVFLLGVCQSRRLSFGSSTRFQSYGPRLSIAGCLEIQEVSDLRRSRWRLEESFERLKH